VPEKPYPTSEFTCENKAAQALAGTVALPSPFPASGRIFIGIKPRLDETIPEQYYVKIVETINDKFIVTRLVNLEDFRAVRLRPESGRYDNMREWTLKTAEDMHKELEEAKYQLKEAAGGSFSGFELLLFPERKEQGYDAGLKHRDVARTERQGVVYVPETAPVLVRTEQGLPAAEAVESVRFKPFKSVGMGCCMEPSPRDSP
jgi:hypothetical protein